MPSKKKIIRTIQEWFLEKGFMDNKENIHFYRLKYGCAEYGEGREPVVSKKMSYDLLNHLENKFGTMVFEGDTIAERRSN